MKPKLTMFIIIIFSVITIISIIVLEELKPIEISENSYQYAYITSSNSNYYQAKQVYITPTGKRYHLERRCGGENSTPVSLDLAESLLLTPCKKCACD